MVAASRAEQAQPQKYYNRTKRVPLRVVSEEAQEAPARQNRPARVSFAAIAQTTALIVICLSVGVLTVAGYERLTSASLQVANLKKQITGTKTRIDKLDVQIACAVDLDHIMDKATGDLKMIYPQQEQVVQLNGVASAAPERLAYKPAMETEAAVTEMDPAQSAFSAANAPSDDSNTGDGSWSAKQGGLSAAAAGEQDSATTQTGQDQAQSGTSSVPSYAATPMRITTQDDTASSSVNLILSAPQ